MINIFQFLWSSSVCVALQSSPSGDWAADVWWFRLSGRGARSATRPLGRNIERAQCPQRSHVGGVSGTQRIVRIVALSLWATATPAPSTKIKFYNLIVSLRLEIIKKMLKSLISSLLTIRELLRKVYFSWKVENSLFVKTWKKCVFQLLNRTFLPSEVKKKRLVLDHEKWALSRKLHFSWYTSFLWGFTFSWFFIIVSLRLFI